jgi:iron complex transport system ATP-binding protein
MLRLQNLTCGYPRLKAPVVTAPDLELPAGSFICVIGRNGAGKSTLMRTLAGLQPALSGGALLEGVDIARLGARARSRRVAVVTTERVSSPGLYARDVVEIGRQPFTDWQGRLGHKDVDAVEDAFRKAGAEAFAPKLFDALSDGERQRVMIARALAQSPRLMILDEITAFLDLPGRVEIMSLLRRHARETGTLILISSHDLELSLELADQLWVVDKNTLSHAPPSDAALRTQIANSFETAEVAFDPLTARFTLRKD